MMGHTLGNKYRLISEIARGPQGSLWRAEHLVLRFPVAVKFMPSPSGEAAGESETAAERADAMKRFLSEARIAAAARGPHVAQVFDYGVDHGTPYLVREILEGESLAARLQRVGRLSPAETARILAQVARALERMHDLGIVHRDLKPENIFLVAGEKVHAKILDFGVARVSDQALLTTLTPGTRTGDLVGTPNYMSPEQLQNPHSLDHRSDIWALGVIAFECLLGRLPFVATHLMGMIVSICSRPLPIPALLGPVPRGFDAWFARACARDLERRFATAKEAAAVLEALCPPRELPTAPSNAEAALRELPPRAARSGLKRLWSGFFARPDAAAAPRPPPRRKANAEK